MKTQTSYTPLFAQAVTHLLKIEGEYIYDSDDAGGETKYGISKRQYPHLNIASIRIEDAKAIYYRDYWRAYRCDELERFSPRVACFLFDSVVNHRPKVAIKFLQAALKVSVDGIIGKQTLGAIKQISCNARMVEAFLERCFMYRADFYHDLVIENPSQDKFFMGRMRRLFSLQRFIYCEFVITHKEGEKNG